MELARTLSYNYIFRGLPKEVVAGIAAMAAVRDYMGGDTIVRQFDRSSDLFVILEGYALIKSYRGETVAEFGPGSVIGEVALIDEQPRSASVVARGPVKAAIISKQVLQGMMDTDPETARTLLMNISRVLCRRLRSMNAVVEDSRPVAKIA